MKALLSSLIVGIGTLITLGSVFGVGENYSCQMGDLQPEAYAGGLMLAVGASSQSLQILTQNDIAIALTMLKRDCCARGLLASTYCEGQSLGPNYQPQSPYLIDHLMHIGMTKLDGDEEVCQMLGLEGCAPADPSLDIDPVQRRSTIREIAQSTDGKSAQEIQDLYTLYRGGQDGLTKTGAMVQGYYALCDELDRFVDADGITAINESETLVNCTARIKQRIEQETVYVQTLMVEKGAQYIVQSMRDYFKEYFADQRLSGLATKYGMLEACWSMVLQTVQPTSNCCN